MILDHRVTVPATPDRTWAFLMDIPQMASCVPGVETVTETGPGVYTGILGIRVGPVGVRLEGRVRVAEQDPTSRTARLEVEATDRRIRGAVSAWSAMRLEARGDGTTDLVVHTEASVLGKLGQFGQAVLRKKADQLVGEWAANLGRALAPPDARR